MTNKYNRLLKITLRGRAKGRKTYPLSISLTQDQIDYLGRQPNASALVRKILDEKLGVIALNLQLKEFEKKLENLRYERMKHLGEKDYHWMHVTDSDGGRYIDWADRDLLMPKPLDTEEAQVALRVLKGYDDAIAYLEQKIAEIKKQILQGG